MRRLDDVRVDIQRRRDTRVSELLLRDLHRHPEVIEQRRMNVEELMPRHSSQPGLARGRLQNPRQQFRLTERFTVPVAEQQSVRIVVNPFPVLP